jgi:hypothetical protein
VPETRRPKPAAMVNSPDLEEPHRRVAKPTLRSWPAYATRTAAHQCQAANAVNSGSRRMDRG